MRQSLKKRLRARERKEPAAFHIGEDVRYLMSTHTSERDNKQTPSAKESESRRAKFGKWEERENVAASVEISSRRVWRAKCREIVQISGRGLSDPGMCVRPGGGGVNVWGEAGSVGGREKWKFQEYL